MTPPSPRPTAEHTRRLATLAAPIVLTQLGTMALGVVDTVMVGHLGVHELDAAALGNAWLFGTILFGMGVMLGLDPIITQAFGAGDGRRLALALQRGIVIALITSLPLAASWTVTGQALRAFGQEPELTYAAQAYVWVQIPSIAPFLIYFALRSYLQGRRIVAPALWVMALANAFNVLANWALIWGHLGLPAMGLEGAGIATAMTRALLCLATAAWIWAFRLHKDAWIPWSREVLSPAGLKEILAFGLPIGLQFGLEGGAFEIATLLAGLLGTQDLAAHAIALNLASLAFMVPLGISMAVTTTVGNFVGQHKFAEAQRSAWVGLVLGVGVMAVSAVIFTGLRYELPALYTDDVGVINLAASVLPIAAAFQ
ncbi:MAG: MATE family efflux transporter, partial [Nannocystaceae bacterium]